MVDNDQQLVANNVEPALCIALAGSGKTKTLIELAQNLVSQDNTRRCYILTFTRAAAAELRERLIAVLDPGQLARVTVSTFDAVFAEQHRLNMHGKPKQTLTGAAQYNFVERVLRSMSLSKIKIVDAISWIDEYGRMLKPQANPNLSEPSLRIFNAYQNLMIKNNKQDFNSIARNVTLGVLSGSIETLPTDYLLVDEYQDTSSMQYEWIRAHGEANIKVIVVGDDDQSIYSWRGANAYDNMVRFQQNFNAKAYLLKTCYRCRPEILAAAKTVIEFNQERISKTMRSAKDDGGKVSVLGYADQEGELQSVVRHITDRPNGWAVLARTNMDLDLVETELKVFGIPYERKGGKKFWDNQVANIILKLLWSLTHPRDNQYIAEILAFIFEDEETILKINGMLVRSKFIDLVPSADMEWSVYTERLKSNWWDWGLDTRDQSEISARLSQIGTLFKDARKGQGDKLIDIVIDAISSISMKGGFFDRVNMLCRHLNPRDKQQEEGEVTNKVVLATLHSSKGLQWPKVWLYASVQGGCPSKAALLNGGVEEERRLYYVGMTRAEEELYMSYHTANAKGSNVEPSQFLQEAFPDNIHANKELLSEKRA